MAQGKQTKNPSAKDEFICKRKNGAMGRGCRIGNENEFLVFKGSTATAELTKYSVRRPNGDKTSEIKEQEKLIAGRQLKRMGDELYIFTEDYPFGSPSLAAAIILGRSTNGWMAWRHKESGKTLDEVYRAKN